MGKIQRICKQCHSPFYVYESAIEKSNASGNFCCRKCYNEYQKTLTGEKNNHYTRIKYNCPNCNKEFDALPSKIKTYKNIFCCRKCKNDYMKNYISGEKNCNWKGGTSRYRGNFDEVKKANFSGKQYCAICGISNGIHIHHIIPYRLTQDNSVDNLIPLCRKHHKIIESVTVNFIELFDSEYDKAKYYLNILLRSRQFETYSIMKQRKDGRIKN